MSIGEHDIDYAALISVAPVAAERARRLTAAMRMLRNGITPREVRERLQADGMSQPTAWRLVDMAQDLTDDGR